MTTPEARYDFWRKAEVEAIWDEAGLGPRDKVTLSWIWVEHPITRADVAAMLRLLAETPEET